MKGLLIILLLLPVQAFAQWAVGNDKQNASGNTVTFTNPLTNPSLIIVICRDSGSPPLSAPSDTAGNSYGSAGGITLFDTGIGGGNRPILQITKACNTHTTASNVVTCNPGNSPWIQAIEFTGGTCTADGSNQGGFLTAAGGGANAIVLPSFNTTADGDLIFATYLPTGGSAFTAGTSPLTFALTPAPIATVISEWATQTTHGSTAATFGYTGGGVTWGGANVAFFKTIPVASATQVGAFAVGP